MKEFSRFKFGAMSKTICEKHCQIRRTGTIPLTGATSIEHRLNSVEHELKNLRKFVQEVHFRNPVLAAEIGTHVGGLSPPSSVEKDSNLFRSDSFSQAIDSQLLEDLYDFYGLQPIELWPLREFTGIHSVEDLIHLAAHVHREHLVRLAHRARSLRQAPLGLAQMPSIRKLRRCYEMSFSDMRSVNSLKTREDLIAFDSVVRHILRRHRNTADLLSNGLYEFASREQILAEKKLMDTRQMKVYQEVQGFFDTFSDTRVRVRFMLGHHAALSAKLLKGELDDSLVKATQLPLYDIDGDAFTGLACLATDARKVVLAAIRSAKESEVEDTTLIPPIILRISEPGVDTYEYNGTDLRFSQTSFTYPSVPFVLYGSVMAMVGEAIRSNVIRKLRFGIDCESIVVDVTQGETLSDVSVSVSDVAGGMPLPILKTSLTCVASCRAYLEEQQLCKKSNSSFNRLGCGWAHCPIRMPYAAVASRVFGGDVTISSLEGVGTTRSIFVPTDKERFENILI